MTYKNSLLVDTSYIVSYFFNEDPNHKKAIDLFDTVEEFDAPLITPFIYTEIATVLSQKIGKKYYKKSLKTLKQLSFQELPFNEKIYSQTKINFRELKNKNISFVDLHTTLTAKESQINHVLSFDSHFNNLTEIYNLQLIPTH